MEDRGDASPYHSDPEMGCKTQMFAIAFMGIFKVVFGFLQHTPKSATEFLIPKVFY